MINVEFLYNNEALKKATMSHVPRLDEGVILNDKTYRVNMILWTFDNDIPVVYVNLDLLKCEKIFSRKKFQKNFLNFMKNVKKNLKSGKNRPKT